MSNVLTRAANKLRISIRSIRFVSEHQGRVNVAEINYNIQSKEQIEVRNPEDGKPTRASHVYKKITESMDVSTEPIIEDLLYINKFIMENYFAELMGIESEATDIDLSDNRALKELVKHLPKGVQTTIFDKLK